MIGYLVSNLILSFVDENFFLKIIPKLILNNMYDRMRFLNRKEIKKLKPQHDVIDFEN